MALTAVAAMAGIILLSPGTALAQQKAIVVFNVGGNGIAGTVTFEERPSGCTVAIVGSISGLRPNASLGLHVHTYGDVSNGCDSIGGHWNPLNTTHGDLDADPSHAGDLGNVRTDGAGTTHVNLTSRSIARVGFASLLGRTLAVHNGTDDLGFGNASSSPVNGNSGARLACGVIGVAIGSGSTPAALAATASCSSTVRQDETTVTASASAQSSNANATVPSIAASVTVTSLPTANDSAGQSYSGSSATAFGSATVTSAQQNSSNGYGGNSTSTHSTLHQPTALSVSWSSTSSPSNVARRDCLTNLASMLAIILVSASYWLNHLL